MSPYSFIAMILAGLVTFLFLPSWIERAKIAGLVGRDIHKQDRNEVAEMGGLPVAAGFIAGALAYIAFQALAYKNFEHVPHLFAALTAILIATIIGLVDDILGWKIGLRQMMKVLLTAAISLPIIVLNAGNSVMNLPLIGAIDFGLLYPLLIVPIIIIGSSNGFNMLAGYNGLEAGMGIIILSTLSFIAYRTGGYWIAMLGVCMVAALSAFLFFNIYPSRVFPGDTMTYIVGAMIGIIAIMANIEKFALILFIPYLIQFFLKSRGRMKKESFGKVLKDGSLGNRYKKWYGLEHISISFLRKIKGNAMEWEVVLVIWLFEIVISQMTLIYYFY